jgi:uncharacterized protein
VVFDFLIAGVQVPAVLLIFTGFTVGIVGGFVGVGGGYMTTPALIVFGFPGYMASGIDMTHIAGKGIVSTIRHRQLGNIDWVLALSMIAGTAFGVEEGIRLLGFFKKAGISTIAVLGASVVLMSVLFAYTIWETVKSHRRLQEMARSGEHMAREVTTSRLSQVFQSFPLAPIVRCRTARVVVSMWVIVLVGVVTGVLAGFLGVGGGFIRVPALVYIVGSSTHIAVGTDLVEIVFSGGYGALRHAIEGNVDFVAVMFMMSGAMVGAQVGSLATVFVRGPAIRYVLAFSLALATIGSALPLVGMLAGGRHALLTALSVIVTLGQMMFLCLVILSLVFFAHQARRGLWVPMWVEPLLVHETNAIPVQERA